MGATRRAEKKKMRLLRRELKEQTRAVTARLLGTTVTPKSIVLKAYRTKVETK